MGSSAPQLPASQPAAAAVEPRFRGSFRPRRLEDRAYLTTATSGSIVHCHQPHSLVLSGKRATLGAWGILHTTTLERNRSAHSKQRRKSYWIIQKRHEHTRRVLLDDWTSKSSEVHSWLEFLHCDHDCILNATANHQKYHSCLISHNCRNDFYGRATNLDKPTRNC